jgi:hydrogenase maturation factor
LLGGLPSAPEIVIGAEPGVDAAVLRLGDRTLVLAMDPVTLSAEPGSIAVQINANDIAVMGAEPRWLLASILLPPGSTAADARDVMDGLRERSAELGVYLIGGHTEITPTVTRPVVAACMIGEIAADRLVSSANARPGDVILLAQPVAVEGTGILAAEFASVLREQGVADEVIWKAGNLLREPGICIVPAARALTSALLPHAMHDPTEGGVLTALREMAGAAGVGLRVDADRIPILPECRTICAALGIDPLGLLASGSLLAALEPATLPAAQEALDAAGIESAVIGTVEPADRGLILERDGGEELLPEIERDELARWIERGGDN